MATMTTSLWIFSVFFLTQLEAQAIAPMSCEAIFRSLDDNNNTVERSARMAARSTGSDILHELDFAGKRFILTEEKATGDLFAQIITAPTSGKTEALQYGKGFAARGSANSEGKFTASEVVGFTVYRLECARSSSR